MKRVELARVTVNKAADQYVRAEEVVPSGPRPKWGIDEEDDEAPRPERRVQEPPPVRRLSTEKKLHLATQRLVAESKAIEQNMAMLGKLEGFTAVTTVHATEKGGLNGDTVITLAKYVMEQRGDKTKELVDLQQKLDTLKEQTDFARRKLQELTAGTSKMERDAVAVPELRVQLLHFSKSLAHPLNGEKIKHGSRHHHRARIHQQEQPGMVHAVRNHAKQILLGVAVRVDKNPVRHPHR